MWLYSRPVSELWLFVFCVFGKYDDDDHDDECKSADHKVSVSM